MSGRRDRAVAAWRTEMRSTGRVEIHPRRWLVVLLAISILPLAGLLGVAAVVVRDDVPMRVLFGVLAVALVGLAVLQLRSLRGPVLVVDAEGIHLRRAGLCLPWSAVKGVSAIRVRMVPLVVADVDRRFKREWLAERGRVVRAVHRLDDTVTLGALFRADADHLADWLDQEARQR